jgi:ADP-ribose pyrophosphatase
MRKALFEGKFLRLMDDDGWEFAERTTGAGVVCVVAVDGQHVILVEEFRPAVQAPVISFPAGLIDRAGAGETQETAIEAALRELREETGFAARSIEEVANGPISAGMTTERVTFFLAQDLQAGRQMLDAGEDIKVHRVPLKQLSSFFDACSSRGAEIDLKIFAGLHFVTTRGLMAGLPPWLGGWRAHVAKMQRRKFRDAYGSAALPRSPSRALRADDENDAAEWEHGKRSNADDPLARLGKVLNWAGLTIGFAAGAWVVVCIATLLGAFGSYTDTFGLIFLAVVGAVIGFVGWLAGRTAFYILAGR